MTGLAHVAAEAWESVKRVLPWVLLGIGVACLGLGHFVIDPSAMPGWYGMLTSVGNSLVAGGFFTALVKTSQFKAMFEEALHKIVWADRFVCDRNELKDIWFKVSDELAEQRFPDLKSDLGSLIMKHYLTEPRNFYHQRVRKIVTVTGFDRERNTITFTHRTELTLRRCSVGGEIDYRYSYRPSAGEVVTEREFKIDGKPVSDWEHRRRNHDVEGQPVGPDTRLWLLPTAESYEVVHEFEHSMPLHVAPYVNVAYRTFVRDCRVKASSQVADIGIIFVKSGTVETFKPMFNGAPPGHGDVQMEYTSLLLPSQGFTLMFVRRVW